jgi:hypothetical protein
MRMQANRIILFISTLALSISVLHGADDEFTIITNDVGSQIDLTARTTVDSEYSVVITFNSLQNLSPSTSQTLFNVKGRETPI